MGKLNFRDHFSADNPALNCRLPDARVLANVLNFLGFGPFELFAAADYGGLSMVGIAEVQAELSAEDVGEPLNWVLLGTHGPPRNAAVLNRMLGTGRVGELVAVHRELGFDPATFVNFLVSWQVVQDAIAGVVTSARRRAEVTTR